MVDEDERLACSFERKCELSRWRRKLASSIHGHMVFQNIRDVVDPLRFIVEMFTANENFAIQIG